MITKESSSLVDSKKDGVTQPPILQLEEPSKGTFFSKVKVSLLIWTTFEFSRQKLNAKMLEIALSKCLKIQNDGFLTISNM